MLLFFTSFIFKSILHFGNKLNAKPVLKKNMRFNVPTYLSLSRTVKDPSSSWSELGAPLSILRACMKNPLKALPSPLSSTRGSTRTDRMAEITKTVGPSARGRQKIARADKILDPVGPKGRLKFDQTLTLSYYLFFYIFGNQMQRLSWARHLKASKKDFIYVDILSQNPTSLPHYPLQCPNANQITVRTIMYNYLLLVKFRPQVSNIYWLGQ